MAGVSYAVRAAAILGVGLTLMGCESFRQATGVTKQPPDEFTVLTKAPLVIPPDYNLRPPQPGIASRNEVDPDEQARQLLFQNPVAQAAALGTEYSDSEKTLLAKTNALAVDPDIRRTLSTDVGQEDQGPGFAQRVLFQGVSQAPEAQPAAPAPAAPAPAAAPAAAPR
jgi:hypothetical protein